MADREFWSVNRQFGMKCPEKVLKHILGACKQSGLNETGGILVGFYEERLDCAQVTAATSAPDDSRKGRTWFLDGTTFSRHGSMISGIENETFISVNGTSTHLLRPCRVEPMLNKCSRLRALPRITALNPSSS
jgi:hypothetical protein